MANSTIPTLISNYFTPLDPDKEGNSDSLKRLRPPSSAESLSATPACKKTLTLESSFEVTPEKSNDNSHTINMSSGDAGSHDSLKAMIIEMQKQLGNLATKDDVNKIREECDKVYQRLDVFSKKFDDTIEKFEGRLFNVEQRIDTVIQDNLQLRADNVVLNDRLKKQERELNDLQQYSRRKNLRIFNLKQDTNETAEQLEEKVCDLFTNTIGVDTKPDMLDACHRVPWSASGPAPTFKDGKRRPQDIIVQFKTRKDRDAVLKDRSKCAKKGHSVGEDLTIQNAKLCKAAYKHSGVMSSWSSNGRIKAKLKNGKVIIIPIGEDLDAFIRKHI